MKEILGVSYFDIIMVLGVLFGLALSACGFRLVYRAFTTWDSAPCDIDSDFPSDDLREWRSIPLSPVLPARPVRPSVSTPRVFRPGHRSLLRF